MANETRPAGAVPVGVVHLELSEAVQAAWDCGPAFVAKIAQSVAATVLSQVAESFPPFKDFYDARDAERIELSRLCARTAFLAVAQAFLVTGSMCMEQAVHRYDPKNRQPAGPAPSVPVPGPSKPQ